MGIRSAWTLAAALLAGCNALPFTVGWSCRGDADCPGGRCVAGACVPCASEVCTGGLDEDCDGKTDCADPECEGQRCGPGAPCAEEWCRAEECRREPVAAGVSCRPAAGPCDREEVCDGSATDCPVDGREDATTLCRLSVDACDAPETCDGVRLDCPADAFRPKGEVCRASLGTCDPEEACPGDAPGCPADQRAGAASSCRPSLGACDPAESCDGSSVGCPPDVLLPAGTECAASSGRCELAASCDGSATCPAKTLVSGGTVCRVAVEECDRDETCDGVTAACPADLLEGAGTPCGTSSSCTGTSPSCPGSTTPAPPVFESLVPASPSNAPAPRVKGRCSADTATVLVFDAAGCAREVGSGAKVDFEGGGVEVTVARNATTSLFGVARNAAAQASACTFLAAYVHDDVPPAPPAFVQTLPNPPAGTSFHVVGTSSSDTVSVSLHADEACASPALGTGSKAVFEGAGIAVTLPADADAPVYGRARDLAGNWSGCVLLTTYRTAASWTWMAGGNVADQVGVYGTLRVPAAANRPGSREYVTMWARDTSVWVFGGQGCSSSTCKNQALNDLWRWDGAQWTWWGGDSGPNANGVYGTRGVAAPGNTPGARSQAAVAQDASGNLWLFGGWGRGASNPKDGELNDLWRFDGTNWTWVAGGSGIDAVGVHGTRGVAASSNVPGGRDGAVAWVDAAGLFWLYGGTGCDASSCVTNTNLLQDLWRWDGTAWTWVAGPKTANAPGFWGSLGVPAAANLPSARHLSASWPQGSSVILFGGYGLDAANTRSNLDDLWRWDGSQWTWLGGHSQADQRGVYGTRGAPAATNWPGARDTAAFAPASGGSAWLYGGVGCDSATCDTVSNFLGDLWRWDGAQWTWRSGSNLADERPVHGTRGTPGASNRPGSRKGSGGAVDPSGAFWVFGGRGYDSAGTVSRLGDLWRYR